jgi:hypothetical protein
MECVRQGYATPKAIKLGQEETSSPEETAFPEETEEQQYEETLLKTYKEAAEN